MNSDQQIALDYITAESTGKPITTALGGLKLNKYRAAREQLRQAGLIQVTKTGRWIPCEK